VQSKVKISMIVYIDPSRAPLKDVPQRLLPKAMQQFAESAETYGLKPAPAEGLPGDAIRVNTQGVRNAHDLQEWLSGVGAVVVDVEASDVPALFSHKVTPESLALFRHFPSSEFSQIALEDLNDKLRESLFYGYANQDVDDSEIGLVQQADIVKDLRAGGLDVPEGNRLELWEQANKEKPREVSPEFNAEVRSPFEMPDSMGLL
jgi:hypothetical protein